MHVHEAADGQGHAAGDFRDFVAVVELHHHVAAGRRDRLVHRRAVRLTRADSEPLSVKPSIPTKAAVPPATRAYLEGACSPNDVSVTVVITNPMLASVTFTPISFGWPALAPRKISTSATAALILVVVTVPATVSVFSNANAP